MKRGLFIVVICAALAASSQAQQLQLETGRSTSPGILDWSDTQWWDLTPPGREGISIGKSDFVVRGPVVDLLRPRRPAEERPSLRQRFFNMPWVSPAAPRRADRPVQRADYFAWGEGNAAWSTMADRPIPGPQSTLITISR